MDKYTDQSRVWCHHNGDISVHWFQVCDRVILYLSLFPIEKSRFLRQKFQNSKNIHQAQLPNETCSVFTLISVVVFFPVIGN